LLHSKISTLHLRNTENAGKISRPFSFFSVIFGKRVVLEYSIHQEDTAMTTFFYHFALFDAFIVGAIVLLVGLSMFGHHEA
jgi:hypothetical protein